MVNIKETVIEITVIAVGVIMALYLMNYMGYIQHNSGGIKNVRVIDTKIQDKAPVLIPRNTSLVWTGSD